MPDAAARAWAHLVAAEAADRAQAVRELSTYPHRRDLTAQDVTVILDRYPVMEWDSATGRRYLRLVDEITPGGLAAVLAAVPEEHWVSPDAPAAAHADTGTAHTTLADTGSRDHECDGSCVDTALLVLTAQGLITDRDPLTPAPTTGQVPGVARSEPA